MRISSTFTALALIEALAANGLKLNTTGVTNGEQQDGAELAETDWLHESMMESAYAQTGAADDFIDLAQIDLTQKKEEKKPQVQKK